MPTYQYRCEKCGNKFERTETIAEHEAVKPKCPKCGSTKASFIPGGVYVVTRRAKFVPFVPLPDTLSASDRQSRG